jgi:regulator of sigma E protease
MIGDKEITDNASIKQAIASLDSYSDVLITVKRKQTGLEEQVLINLAIEFNQIGIANFSKEEIMVGQDGAKIGSVFGKSVDKLKPNDIITKIEYDGQSYEVNSWNDLVKHTTSLDGDQLRVTFLREGEVKTEFIHVWENKVLNSQAVNRMFISIGITSQMKYDFFYSLVNPFKETWTSFTQVLSVLGLLMGGSKQIGLNDLSGPVGIFNVIGQVRKQGILALFWFTAFLSVNVGILNLLPIPVLDGGRIVFISYEAITRKKISRKVENIIINIFFILMMLLMLYVTFNDILRLF